VQWWKLDGLNSEDYRARLGQDRFDQACQAIGDAPHFDRFTIFITIIYYLQIKVILIELIVSMNYVIGLEWR